MPKCRSCGQEITWHNMNGKWHPYDLNGTSHFETCPHAKQWRNKRKLDHQDDKFVGSMEDGDFKQSKLN